MILYPGTYVRLLTDVPLNNTYKDTITFESKALQTAYFLSKVKISFDDFRYQPLDSPDEQARLSIPRIADDLYDVNYIMFRNNNFGEKWIYGFVTGIQFVNENMSYITYEVDVMQTWYFDYTLMPSFVQRQHASIDTPGFNLVPENLELGEYKVSNQNFLNGFEPSKCAIVIAATFDKTFADSTSGVVGNIYNGLVYNYFTTAEEASAFILDATSRNLSDGIVSIFMYPAKFAPPDGVTNVVRDSFTIEKSLDSIDGYVPRNKKLFTHPFNFLYITNMQGASAEYAYEYFTTPNCGFYVFGAMSCNPDFVLVPISYKIATTDTIQENYNEKITLSGFPQCSYVTDTFRAYVAQQASSLPVQALSNAFNVNPLSIQSGGAAIMNSIGNLVQGNIGGAIGGVYDSVKKQLEAASLPPQAHTVSGNETGFGSNLRNFYSYTMSITNQFARIIDDYFDMFGYALNRVVVPNIMSRKSWNYVKTMNLQIRGSIPTDDIALIKKIYDAGVTFWHTDKVGDYSLDNSIV